MCQLNYSDPSSPDRRQSHIISILLSECSSVFLFLSCTSPYNVMEELIARASFSSVLGIMRALRARGCGVPPLQIGPILQNSYATH